MGLFFYKVGIMDKNAKKDMTDALDHFREELKNIRTGRANPGMLDSVQVEVYGAQMRLRDLANVTTPEPRQLLVTPYDANNAGSISKAIEKSNLGFTPYVDGNAVRMNIPPMDENMRKEMCKLVNKQKENAKVRIRGIRKDCNDFIRKEKNDGNIAEDEMKRREKQIQDLTDNFCKQADDIAQEKEKEVMAV